MNENKCDDCEHLKTLSHTGWKICGGNQCEVEVRADERTKTIEEFIKFIDKHTHVNGNEICLDDDITILAEEFLKGESK